MLVEKEVVDGHAVTPCVVFDQRLEHAPGSELIAGRGLREEPGRGTGRCGGGGRVRGRVGELGLGLGLVLGLPRAP